MIKTYTPENVLCIIGSIPVVEWSSLTISTDNRNVLLQGKDDELCRLKHRNSKIGVVELVVPRGSIINTLLTILEKTDIPFPIHVVDVNGIDSPNIESVENLPEIAGTLTGMCSQSFLYPATFNKTPNTKYDKTNDTVTWTFYGYVRGTTHMAYYF